MHRYYAPFIHDGETLMAKMTIKEFARQSEGNRIYSVEAVDVVKPAGKLAASISENRRNYVTQAGFEEKLQRKIDKIKGKSSLGSSPEPEMSDAVKQSLAKMPPVYRGVFEAVNSGMLVPEVMAKFKVNEKAVGNILNAVRSRMAAVTAAAGPDGLKPVMRGDKILGGRPDLALSGNPQVAAVDQIRNESGIPDRRGWDQVMPEAAAMLRDDYQGT
jgi:hypothetical protein